MSSTTQAADAPATTITWVSKPPDDVLSALGSMTAIKGGLGRTIPYEDETVETYLGWARSELAEAEKPRSDVKRHTTQAAGHAKRALDRLFSLYIQRDRLSVRLDKRAGFSEKLKMLKLSLGEYLPWRSIDGLVSKPRNVSEHDYKSPTVAEAGFAVESAMLIAESMQSRSNPRHGPAFIGVLGRKFSSGPSGATVTFSGFSSPFALMWPDQNGVAHLGVGVPSDRHAAEIIHCPLKEISLEEHLSILKSWEKVADDYPSEGLVKRLFQLAGIDGPR